VTPALAAESLYRFFHAGDEEVLALQGVSLELAPGEIVAVTGPSGSGKSTLLSCLAGLDEPDGGTVRVDGERLTRRSEEERGQLRAQHIGVLYQSANLIEHLDIEANVGLAQRLNPAESSMAPAEILGRAGIDHRRAARPSQLSGGELARAGLATALANDPSVLLCDEPTGELDVESAQPVLDLLRDRAQSGVAVLVVTHSDNVAEAADRVIHIRDGRIAQ
jgi:putative ABC transport system ATP-binding protein